MPITMTEAMTCARAIVTAHQRRGRLWTVDMHDVRKLANVLLAVPWAEGASEKDYLRAISAAADAELETWPTWIGKTPDPPGPYPNF